jgi:hypothetical protein
VTSGPYSVLFGEQRPARVDETPEPDCFGDLRLDQVVAHLAGNPDRFHLAPLYRALVTDPAVLRLRQDLFDDLMHPEVREALDAFSTEMETVHQRLRAAANLRAVAQANRWHLNAAASYCHALHNLQPVLAKPDRCPALGRIGDHLHQLLESAGFRVFEQTTARIEDELDEIHYAVFLQGDRVTVGAYDDEPDYGAFVVDLFSRFRQDQHHPGDLYRRDDPYRRRIDEAGGDTVRERIVDLVAELHPAVFEQMARFRTEHPDFLDPTVSLFYREIQFYLRYHDLIETLASRGLTTTRPDLSTEPGLEAHGIYDLALALKNESKDTTAIGAGHIVGNDISLSPTERRVVITGPNQGGKTTLSRTIGQLHHLAGIGCPVPGTQVAVQPPDQILSHFERQELGHLTGKLEDDLLRIRTILTRATSRSLVVLNEIFASTTTADAVELATGVLERLAASGGLYVCVTFLDEIAALPDTVTLVAQVDPADVSVRTYRIVRARADGRAYATALARKHGLTREEVRSRVCAST